MKNLSVMLVSPNSENTEKYEEDKYNERSFSTLTRVLSLAQGYFSFVLISCNSLTLRQQIVDRLQANSAIKPRQLLLPKSATTLYATIITELDGEQPPALMIMGIESVVAIDRLLVSTNLLCSEFSKKLSFPLIFWVTDEILRKMIRIAPDLHNRMPTAIRFISNSPENHKNY
ncbi:hypothetical protein [Tychonema sp. BBK16]|uniref:hypothetical protein n=1 Tax=Tychonema sp. BBK16 TaxID=2699888 RepID=UPI001F444AFA|nr:hypothetical protein [Tychonema sp. BBK16]MCF6375164.1 hypothetical protein [Tychonema sp. BBK16]